MRRALLRKNASGGGFAFGNCLDYDATGYVSLNMSVTNQWSYVFWFYPTAIGIQFLAAANSSTNFIRFDDEETMRFRVSTNNVFTWPTGTIAINNWHSCVVTFDAGEQKMYIDGVASSSNPMTAVDLSWDFTYLGRRGTSGSQFYGYQDESAFYDGTIWTAANAVSFHNGGAGISAPDVVASPTAHWKFDESGTDTTLVDSSGNGNNGTLISFPSSGMWIAH